VIKGKPTRRDRFVDECWIHLNFLRVVLPQFKVSIGVFLSVNLLGSLVIWSYQPHHSFASALYSAFALNLFEVADGFPTDGGFLVQAVYFILPAVGLTVIAEGFVRLGVTIFNRKRLSEEWHMALASTFKNHVVIAGLGRIGGRVAQRLQSEEQLVCIERNQPDGVALSENVAILIGDASNPEVLAKANVAKARAILALTDNDLANLEIALNAREANPEIRVILRFFNDRLGEQLVQKFGFQAVFSTSGLAAPSFSSALYSSKILQTIDVGDDKVVHLARFQIRPGSPLIGRTILEAEQQADVSVILHHTQGKTDLLPSAEAKIAKHDEVYVLAELRNIDLVDRLSQG